MASRIDARLSRPELTAFAAHLALALRPGDVIALSGDLGAGKTTFARGILRGLGWAGEVPSPTFTLLQTYDTDPPLWHVDLYRLESPDEAEAIGLDDAWEDAAVVIEWPERLGARLPHEALRLHLAGAGTATRTLTATVPKSWEGRWPPPTNPGR